MRTPSSSFGADRIFIFLRHPMITFAWLMVAGCSAALDVRPMAQSSSVPNGTTIVAIGETVGISHGFDFTVGGLPNHVYPAIMKEAIRSALAAKGGDILINSTLSMRVTQFPILLVTNLNAWWIRWTLEGTAARVEVQAGVLDDRSTLR